ncbi:MAG: AEC family transporter [Anaerolineae bacterium]
MTLLRILLNIIFPVFVIIGLGYLLGRTMTLDVKSVSRTVLYIFSPALVFSSLAKSSLTSSDFSHIVSFALLTIVVLGFFSWGITRLLRFDQVMENAFLLSTLFINAGNYGLPVNLFAFGQPGLERAIIYFVTSALLTNTLAVYFASRGRSGVQESLLNIFKVPMVYALTVALLVRATGFTVPDPIFKPIEIAGQAAVPVLLVTLGMELAHVSLDQNMAIVGLATGVRLVLAAGVALGIAALMGLQGVTRQVCLVQASMPTAVLTTVLAIEFGAEPRFVTSVVFLSTLASIVTLTLLLSLIM